jgi:transposase
MGGDPAALAEQAARRAAVDDRRVLNGILWRFRTGAPWRDIPERYGPRTTLYNRFVRWRAAGVWDRILEAISQAYDGDIVMIDSSCVRVHQHGASGKKGVPTMAAWDGRRGPRLFGAAG